jgi:hypothetical protein
MKDKKNILILALLVTVAFLTVGYGITAAQLDLRSAATSIIDSKWDIKITKIENPEVVGWGENISFDMNGTSAKFKTKLVTNMDSVIYNVTVTNNGNVDVVLDSFVQNPEMDEYVIYSVTGLSNEVVLSANKSITFQVTARFNETAEIPEENFSKITESLLVLNYVQSK